MKAAIYLFPAVICAVVASGEASAQSQEVDDTTKLAEEIIDCAGLDVNAERLKCYDEVAAPLLGLDDAPADSGAATALHQFTGKDNWDSEALEFGKPWRLIWQNQGSLLTVELHTSEGELVDVIGNQIGAGGGRSEVLDPGSYRLAVRGIGAWRLQVVREAEEGQN